MPPSSGPTPTSPTLEGRSMRYRTTSRAQISARPQRESPARPRSSSPSSRKSLLRWCASSMNLCQLPSTGRPRSAPNRCRSRWKPCGTHSLVREPRRSGRGATGAAVRFPGPGRRDGGSDGRTRNRGLPFTPRVVSVGRGAPVLGISTDFHDSAAALLLDGVVVCAAEEERFTRVKHDPSLPRGSDELVSRRRRRRSRRAGLRCSPREAPDGV